MGDDGSPLLGVGIGSARSTGVCNCTPEPMLPRADDGHIVKASSVSTAARISCELLRIGQDQLGDADLIGSARRCALAAGGKFFPTADASMRRGGFGRGAAGAGNAEGCRPPCGDMPAPQSPDRLSSTFGGAPVPESS
jgi:hypothetical protein